MREEILIYVTTVWVRQSLWILDSAKNTDPFVLGILFSHWYLHKIFFFFLHNHENVIQTVVFVRVHLTFLLSPASLRLNFPFSMVKKLGISIRRVPMTRRTQMTRKTRSTASIPAVIQKGVARVEIRDPATVRTLTTTQGTEPGSRMGERMRPRPCPFSHSTMFTPTVHPHLLAQSPAIRKTFPNCCLVS